MRVSAALMRQAEVVVNELLRFDAPADQVVSAYFRKNRNLGQQDRAFVAETAFAVLRRKRSLESAAGSAEPTALVGAALVRVLGSSGRVLDGLVDPELVAKLRAASKDMPDAVRAEQVEEVITRVSGKLLERVALFDRYVGQGVEPGHRSLAWRLTFRHAERTLREREIDARRTDILKALADELNVRQRTG